MGELEELYRFANWIIYGIVRTLIYPGPGIMKAMIAYGLLVSSLHLI